MTAKMQYLFVREPARDGQAASGDARTAGDLVLVLLHDMATTRSLALGELRVRQRMQELGIQPEDCETLCGNLAAIAATGPRTPEEREILAFYFALGLRGKIRETSGPRRDRVSILLRETLDFLAVVFGPRCLQHLTLLDDLERQLVWDLIGGTVLALGREVSVPGVEPVGGLGRWCALFAAAPRPDRRVAAHSLLAHGVSPTARLAVVGILDPAADADILAGVAATPSAPVAGLLAEALEGPLEVPALEDEPTPTPAPVDVTVRGRAVRVRSLGRRLVRGVTGWALVERVLRAFGSVFLGLRREAALRLTSQGLVYDESLWMLGRAVSKRTVGIPFEAVAARLDRRQGFAALVVGLLAATAAGFLAVLWTLDGLRTGYRPLFLLAGGVLALGVAVDLLLYRVSGKLRGRSHLTLDGGRGARIRLEGIRREEAESLLSALAGPGRAPRKSRA
jgi:hypothetical protein